MVKLKCIDNGLNPVFEVVSGKRGYKKFLETIGYSRTFTMFDKIDLSKINKYEVVFMGDLLYLDYNVNCDLVLVKKITRVEYNLNQSDLKTYFEAVLSEEFGVE